MPSSATPSTPLSCKATACKLCANRRNERGGRTQPLRLGFADPPPSSHRPALRRAGVSVGLFSEKAFIFFSKTLALQVRFAHPSSTQGRLRLRRFLGSPFVGRSAAEACAFWSQSPGGALTENKPCATPERPEGAFRCEECKGSCHAHGVTEGLFVPPTQKRKGFVPSFLFYAKSFHASGAISSTARGRQRISAWVRCPAHSPSAVHSAGSSKSMLTCPAEKK